MSHPAPESIAESLETYAARTRRTPQQAYADWHAHGNRTAADWSGRQAAERRLDLKGSKCLGLTPEQVTAQSLTHGGLARLLHSY
jgi:hypothetical protein